MNAPTAAPTPEQFLAGPPDPEEDADEIEQLEAPAPKPSGGLHTTPRDSLESIADSLRRITAVVEKTETEATEESQAQQQVAALDNMIEELGEQLAHRQRLIDQVLAVIKPSTSKLANNVRAVLEPPVAPPLEPEPAPGSGAVEQPAHDADVEEWRAYARSLSPQVEVTDIDTANRSQIRTMLGISQTEGGGE